jgi:hypothetical protein
MRTLRAVVGVLVLLASLANGPATRAAQQPTIPPTPPTPMRTTQAAVDCSANSSPFGGVLTLGRENEAMVSYAGGFFTANQSWLLNTRYDLNASKSLYAQDSWPPAGQTPSADLRSVSVPVATAVDLNGDGTDELIQAFIDANGRLRVGKFSAGGASFNDLNRTDRQQLAIAAGNITRRTDEGRQFVIASTTNNTGALSVLIPVVSSDGTIYDTAQSIPATWSTVERNRDHPRAISAAIGDLDGDGFKNEIVLAIADKTGALQIIVLKNDPSVAATGSYATTYSYHIKEIASTTLGVNDPNTVKVAIGDVDARYRNGDSTNFTDEIVIATDDTNPDSPGVSGSLGLYTLRMRVIADDQGNVVNRLIEQAGSWTGSAYHSDLQLAVGDTDGDGRAEPVLAYRSYGDNNPLVIETFDAERPTIAPHNMLMTYDGFRNGVGSLALTVGDMDRDGLAEIVAAFRDSGQQLQVIQVADQVDAKGMNGLQLHSATRDNTGGRNGAYGISLAIGDWDGDSLKAVYAPAYGGTLRCQSVEEPNLAAVVFPPPYWQRLQGERIRQASLGQSTSSGTGAETNIETSSSHSVTVFAGLEVGGELGPVELEASLKATGGYEYKATHSNGGGIEGETKISQRFDRDNGAFAVIQRTHHDCYTYQLQQGAQTLDGAARFCEERGHDTASVNLENWDTDYGPAKNADTQQWAPVGRDWASLSLFRSATQSSTAGAASASRAVDGDTGDLSAAHSTYQQTGARLTDGTVSSTQVQAQPWWQVDLGHTQALTALRIWHRYNYDCDQQTCAAQMGSFYVFVSDTDFSRLSNNPSVLKNDPRVHAYFFQHAAPKVTNVQLLAPAGNTLEPIQGRYVRVQLAGTAALSLAEVQVFGDKHIDPDRYPVWLRDPDAGTTQVPDPNDGNKPKTKYTPGTDGWFEVGVYAPDGTVKPVRMRGNLLWSSNGALQYGNTQGIVKITKSDTLSIWSMAEERKSFLTERQAIEHNVSVGAEIEAKGGVGAKVVLGGGYEFSTGVLTDTTNTVAWGKGLEIGGAAQGFPSTLDGQPVSLDQVRSCEYGFQPFYYEADEEATSGYQHRFMVVDSVVPDAALNRGADMSFCQEPISTTPTFESDVSSGAPGSSFVLTASGLPANARTTLALKRPGDADYRTLTRLTMKSNGQLVFVLATKPGDALGEYSLRLSIDQASQASSALPTGATSLTTSVTLVAGAPIHTVNPPVGSPVVSTDGSVLGGQRVYLPLIVR